MRLPSRHGRLFFEPPTQHRSHSRDNISDNKFPWEPHSECSRKRYTQKPGYCSIKGGPYDGPASAGSECRLHVGELRRVFENSHPSIEFEECDGAGFSKGRRQGKRPRNRRRFRPPVSCAQRSGRSPSPRSMRNRCHSAGRDRQSCRSGRNAPPRAGWSGAHAQNPARRAWLDGRR